MRKWSEIRNDYIDETDMAEGFAEMYIDAWETGDDSEEGKSIAVVLAIKADNAPENKVKVIYIDNQARVDKYAQEVINEGIEIMKELNFN